MTEEMNRLTEQGVTQALGLIESTESVVGQGLAKALAYVEATESFVVEQAPLLVQEMLRYGLFHSLFWAGFWAVAFGGVMWCAVKLYKLLAKDDIDPFAGVMLGIGAGGGCLGGCFACLFTAVKILIAPRLYLLGKLSTLV